MTASSRDSLADLERLRLVLEGNIAKLRKSLQHWQTWEVEYEGLKEELSSLPEDASRDDIVSASLAFEGSLVNEKEINDILGNGPARRPRQVVGLVSRRIDYVGQNIKSIQKQLVAAEDRLGAAAVISQPEARDEERLPLTEIYEELDEEGNVISGRTHQPGEAAPHMLEALRKAGVKDEDFLESLPVESAVETKKAEETQSIKGEPLATNEALLTTIESAPSRQRKKSVSFAEGTKDETTHSTTTAHSTKAGPKTMPSRPSPNRLTELTKGSFTGADRVIELDENDTPVAYSTPMIPVNESPEDAALRRQMLQYNMAEVGNIVAELDLEENTDSYSDDDYSDDDEAEIGSTSSADDENEYGMSTHGFMSEEYRKQMVELEERMNAQMIQNIGPQSTNEDSSREDMAKSARSIRVLPTEETSTSKLPPKNKQNGLTAEEKSKAKSVRFASTLDVASSNITPSSKAPSAQPPRQPKPPPPTVVSRTITERPATTPRIPSAPTARPSRFKAARTVGPATPLPPPIPPSAPSSRRPTGPANAIVAPTLIERAPSSTTTNNKAAAPPAEPDELDPEILQQQVAREYYTQRNRMVQGEGGFLRFKEEQAETLPEEDERGGGGERVSLFKAARLRRAGGGV